MAHPLEGVLHRAGPTVGNEVDWDAVESAYGRALPSDYQEFIRVYGSGSIENYLEILGPATNKADLDGDFVSGLHPSMRERSAGEWCDPANIGRYDLGDMLVWGITESDVLCWIATDPDPQAWPVAVYARQDAAWSVYPFGLVDFLVRLLGDDFEKWPVSDISLRKISMPRFFHTEDQELWDQ